MVLFPNCKINLGLRVKEKRTDGYHNIETIFFPLPLRDALELVRTETSATGTEKSFGLVHTPTPNTQGKNPSRPVHAETPAVGTSDPFGLTLSGTAIPGTAEDNLCWRAWKLIKADFPDIPPLHIYLHKAIPAGGGLGGGSSDGVHTLLLLNAELNLGLSDSQLQEYAARLGSDCPFFLINRPCLATGRGEVLEELSVDLHDYYFLLIDPQLHVSTAEAFSQISASTEAGQPLKEIIGLPVKQWKDLLVNEFEVPVHKRYPVLAALKEKLYEAGAAYASMTGTGSCIYAIFNKRRAVSAASFRKTFQPYSVYILNRDP